MLGADHHGYVQRLRTLSACAGDDPDRNIEVLIGQLVKLERGGQEVRLSKRAGAIVTLDELIDAVGVDAGSSRTRCVICVCEDQRLRFLAASSVPARGFHKGLVADVGAISQSIQEAIKEAETRSRVLVDAVVLGLGGGTIESSQGRGVYERAMLDAFIRTIHAHWSLAALRELFQSADRARLSSAVFGPRPQVTWCNGRK